MNGDPAYDFGYLIGAAIPLAVIALVIVLAAWGIVHAIAGAAIVRATDVKILHHRRRR